MSFCRVCGAEHAERARFCPSCGSAQLTRARGLRALFALLLALVALAAAVAALWVPVISPVVDSGGGGEAWSASTQAAGEDTATAVASEDDLADEPAGRAVTANEPMRADGTHEKPLSEMPAEECVGCHDYDEVVNSTADWGGDGGVNPHFSHNGQLECSYCHKDAGQSTMYCNECHDLQLPDGWAK